MRVRTARTQSVLLNGVLYKATIDASGRVTQIVEDHAQHAVVRPQTIDLSMVAKKGL